MGKKESTYENVIGGDINGYKGTPEDRAMYGEIYRTTGAGFPEEDTFNGTDYTEKYRTRVANEFVKDVPDSQYHENLPILEFDAFMDRVSKLQEPVATAFAKVRATLMTDTKESYDALKSNEKFRLNQMLDTYFAGYAYTK